MIDFSPLKLPNKAYLVELLHSEDGLAKMMSGTVARTGGFYALLPQGTPLARAEEFEAGGLVPAIPTGDPAFERIPTNESELVARVLNHSGVFIAQDFWAAGIRYDRRHPDVNLLNLDGMVYLWTEIKPLSGEAIRSCWLLPTSWRYAGFLVEDPSAAQELRSEIPRMDKLVNQISEIYAPAYDHESFLIWSRRNQAS